MKAGDTVRVISEAKSLARWHGEEGEVVGVHKNRRVYMTYPITVAVGGTYVSCAPSELELIKEGK